MDLGPRTKNPVDAESTPTLPDVDLDEKPKRVPTQSADLIRTVGDRWNELAASLHLSQVAELHATRKSKILARAEDLVKIYEFPDPLTGFSDLFSRIRGSPFLRGESKPRNGEKPFRCHFEFAFEKSSFTSIMEGKYEDRSQGTAGR